MHPDASAHALPSPTAQRSRIIAAVTALGMIALAITLGAHPRRGIDLRVYLTAASRFLEGTQLYLASDGAMPFKYAPPGAALFAPLLALPARAATVLWNLLGVAALLGSARWWIRRLELKEHAAELTALTLLALGHPLFFELHYAQVDLVMLGLLTLTLDGLERRRPLQAGIALALVTVLKPPALLFLLLFAHPRHLRAAATWLTASAALWLPVLLRYGFTGTRELIHDWSALVERTTAPWVLGYNPQGLPTLLLAPFFPVDAIPSPALLTLVQLGAVALFLGAIVLFRPNRPALHALFVLGVAYLSPLAWRANFVLAIPGVLLAISSRRRSGWIVTAAVGLVGAIVQPGVLGEARFRSVMIFRPFALAFLALVVWTLSSQRASRWIGATSPSPQTK